MKKSNARRADGRIMINVYTGTVDGKKKYKSVYGKTQKEAEQKAKELKEKIDAGLSVSASDSFHIWSERWLKYKSYDVSSSQVNVYKSAIKNINEYIGRIPIDKIKIEHIQKIIDDYSEKNPHTDKPTAKRTLTLIKTTATQIFDYAIMNRVINFNPVQYAKVPRDAPKKERRALTPEERRWIDKTPHRMQTPAMIMLYAGLRRGEVIPLEWSDIDLKNGTIEVNKAVEFVNRTPQIKRPKTKSGIRTVYIPDKLVNYLKNIESENEKSKIKSMLVCPSIDGKMYTLDKFRRGWESYMTDIDVKYAPRFSDISKYDPKYKRVIQNITPHMLRHTFCTMMYESGVDIMTAKEQMGHASIETTLEIYTHISNESKKQEIQKMNKNINTE